MTADQKALKREELRMALRSHFREALEEWRASGGLVSYSEMLDAMVNAAETAVQYAQQEARAQTLEEAAIIADSAETHYKTCIQYQVTDTSKATYEHLAQSALHIAVAIRLLKQREPR